SRQIRIEAFATCTTEPSNRLISIKESSAFIKAVKLFERGFSSTPLSILPFASSISTEHLTRSRYPSERIRNIPARHKCKMQSIEGIHDEWVYVLCQNVKIRTNPIART